MRAPASTPDASASRAALRHVHKDLRAHLRKIQDCADQEFAGSFPRLIAEVEAGLRHEEAILEAEHAPHLRERRAENAMILCALHRVSVRVEQGYTELGRQVAAALQDMVALHRLAACLAPDGALDRPRRRRRLARARSRAVPPRKRHLGHLH